MLIEVVALSLTVLSTFASSPSLPADQVVSSSPSLTSTIPEDDILAMLEQEADTRAFEETTIPDAQLVAMLSEPTPTETPIPTTTPIPTRTPTPTIPVPTTTPSPTTTPTPTETPTPTLQVAQQSSPSDIDGFFERFSSEYKVDKELLRRIAACESGFNASARNDIYGGMYQFADATWSVVRGRMGHDTNPELRFSAEEAIRTAAYYIANGGQSAWPNC